MTIEQKTDARAKEVAARSVRALGDAIDDGQVALAAVAAVRTDGTTDEAVYDGFTGVPVPPNGLTKLKALFSRLFSGFIGKRRRPKRIECWRNVAHEWNWHVVSAGNITHQSTQGHEHVDEMVRTIISVMRLGIAPGDERTIADLQNKAFHKDGKFSATYR